MNYYLSLALRTALREKTMTLAEFNDQYGFVFRTVCEAITYLMTDEGTKQKQSKEECRSTARAFQALAARQAEYARDPGRDA